MFVHEQMRVPSIDSVMCRCHPVSASHIGRPHLYLYLGLLKAFLYDPPGPGHSDQFLQCLSRQTIRDVVGRPLGWSSYAGQQPIALARLPLWPSDVTAGITVPYQIWRGQI